MTDEEEGDGATVFAHACKPRARRHRVQAEGLALSLGALARLAQDEERKRTGREARGGGGLEAPPMKLTGARFEISIDGTPRTHRDRKPLAIEAPEHLKRKRA